MVYEVGGVRAVQLRKLRRRQWFGYSGVERAILPSIESIRKSAKKDSLVESLETYVDICLEIDTVDQNIFETETTAGFGWT